MTTTDIDTTADNQNSHGVFQLPTQTEIPLSPEGTAGHNRQGASSISDMLSDGDRHLAAEDDFPMIVWLRGDEPWFTQFDMDADSTMAALGIKRSRLTQIAGRDLRVGRVRVDRYIRPVFRSIDVAAYLHQTRATASHQKSSEALQVASLAFNAQIDRFQSTLDAISSNLTAQLNSVLGTLIGESITQSMAPLHARIDSLEADVVNRISVTIQDTILKHVDTLKEQMTTSDKETAVLLGDLLKSHESTKSQLKLSTESTSERLNDLDRSVLSIKTDVHAYESSVEGAIKTVKKDIVQLTDIILSTIDAQTEQIQPKATLAWRAAPRRRRMRPS